MYRVNLKAHNLGVGRGGVSEKSSEQQLLDQKQPREDSFFRFFFLENIDTVS